RKLDEESVVWLTTVADDGTPQPNPVWFLPDPDGDGLLTYNRETAVRVRHVRRRPRVSLHFDIRDGDDHLVVVLGTAEIDEDALPSDSNPAYQTKYRDRIRSLGMDSAGFAAKYPVAIRVRFAKVRGW